MLLVLHCPSCKIYLVQPAHKTRGRVQGFLNFVSPVIYKHENMVIKKSIISIKSTVMLLYLGTFSYLSSTSFCSLKSIITLFTVKNWFNLFTRYSL